MKTNKPVSTKKQPVTLKDLKTRKNPKGGTGTHTITAVYSGCRDPLKLNCVNEK